MDIFKRIKSVREKLNLSQEDFASNLKLQRNTISLIENGKRNPSDRTLSDICKVFGVNEIWLRTGEGGDECMFSVIDENDLFPINVGKILKSDDKFIKSAVNVLANTEPEKLKIIEEFMMELLGINKKQDR